MLRETRNREEIEEAIRTFSDADWIRLRNSAVFYARPWFSSDDLLQETFRRALEENRRKCPVDVDVVRFLSEAMRSIAHGEQEKASNQQILESVNPDDLHDEKIEEDHESDDMVRIIRAKIMTLFEDDRLARDIIDGLMDGMKASEIREITEIDKKSYASKRTFIRRRLSKRYPRGWEL